MSDNPNLSRLNLQQPLLIMRIACDTQMATCDLSFEVSSDLSSQIFIWTKVKPDFSLLMPTPCEKEHS